MSDKLYGVEIQTDKRMPKTAAYFVDERTARRWEEADKVFRKKWWSPLWWLGYWRTHRAMKREALAIIKNIGD